MIEEQNQQSTGHEDDAAHTRSRGYTSIKAFGRKDQEYGQSVLDGIWNVKLNLVQSCRFSNHRHATPLSVPYKADSIVRRRAGACFDVFNNVPTYDPCPASASLRSNPCHTHRHYGSPLRQYPNDHPRLVLETSPAHTSSHSSRDAASFCSN